MTSALPPSPADPHAALHSSAASLTSDSAPILTTNQGVRVADNQNSLKGGLRGPTLMEDFILREKLTHFDHERIPERVVNARGAGAHGYFECDASLGDVTCAVPLTAVGRRTPVFVRFSTLAGERGSADTVRDVRGFAVKFYTEEGNWDLVGNNMPVFFIQDAMKFPDLVHALKPEPHHGMPQASSAHDTFWDFVSLTPESTHMLLWLMSDRALPRSYRMMQGFGVHTFRLVNAAGASVLCKFHWTPLAGTHSLTWDEALKLASADPDFHRRDLWEAIKSGDHPQWELGVQVFSEEEAERFAFDVLDPTKLVPEELVPLRRVGRLVLDRNPTNFFAETEQVAFCAAHVIPGIDFSDDPLLHGRIHAYLDTQLKRLGGPNFHEIPVNAPRVPVHNNQRDGMHRQSMQHGCVAYEPNSLGGGCPFPAGPAHRGFRAFPAAVEGHKLRAKPERFAEHFAQARLFWRSQTAVEQHHIKQAFRFELTRVRTPEVRARVLSLLARVDEDLVRDVAAGLGMAAPAPLRPLAANLPDMLDEAPPTASPALSLFAHGGSQGVRTRRVALLVADGVRAESLLAVHAVLAEAGAVPCLVGERLGTVRPAGGALPLPVATTFAAAPSALWDALVLPDGDAAQPVLASAGAAMEFIRDQYRHAKPILALGRAKVLLEILGINPEWPDGVPDPGVVLALDGDPLPSDVAELASTRFLTALAEHRHFERETRAIWF